MGFGACQIPCNYMLYIIPMFCHVLFRVVHITGRIIQRFSDFESDACLVVGF